MSQPTKTPIAQSLIDRVSGAVRFAVSGKFPEGWFGPGDTIAPVAPKPQVEGRRLDFPVAINTRYTPRQGEAVSFDQMRALADSCDILRLVIETRKDQIAKLAWKIVPIDTTQAPDAKCEALTAFFRQPDKEHSWADWLRMLLEDLFVIDAPTVYPRRTVGGGLYSLEPINGATIKRVLDEFGRTPLPPLPAYQQILHGMPAVDYSRDELMYRPRNPRTHKIYGYSPVEQIIITVNMALRRAVSQLSYYTDGNTPNLVFGVPTEWNPDQIAQFQSWWDLLNVGESKHAAKFVPGGVKPFDTKDQILKDEFDEWLARIVCFAFSIAPTPFIKSNNRATAETAQEQSVTEGLAPLQMWVKSLVDDCIQRADLLNMPGLQFVWDEEDAPDPSVQTKIHDTRLRNGSMTIDEVRAADGDEPLPNGLGAVPLIYTAQGAIRVEDAIKEPPPPPPALAAANGDPNAPPGSEPGADPSAPPEPGKPSPPKPGAPAAKLEKKKPLKPIDHERSTVTSAADAIQAALVEFFDRARADVQRQLEQALSKVAKSGGENNELADAHAKRVEEILADLDLTMWDELPDELAKFLVVVSKDGVKEALLQLGLDEDADITSLANLKAIAYAQERAAEMVGMRPVDGELVPNPNAKWRIDDGTREMLRVDVTAALDEGWSNDTLAARLKQSYAFSDTRAETVARTETARADVAGNVAGWKASGVVEKRRWLAAPDCCDICQEIDGETADLDGTYPGGVDGAPLHPSCRCNEVPVMAGEE